MKTLSIREVREQLPEIERIVAENGEILVTRRGRPIARILALGRRPGLPSRRSLREQMTPSAVSSAELIRADRDER